MKTQERIMSTTYELIGTHGYEKTSTAMICDSVGITKPSLYYYFKSKEELFLEIIRQFLNGGNTLQFNLSVDKEKYFDELLQFGLNFLETYKDSEVFSSFILEVYTQSKRVDELGDIIRNYNELFKSELKNILLVGVKHGLLDESKLEILTNSMYGTIHGIEASIMFGTDIDHPVVWSRFVETLQK